MKFKWFQSRFAPATGVRVFCVSVGVHFPPLISIQFQSFQPGLNCHQKLYLQADSMEGGLFKACWCIFCYRSHCLTSVPIAKGSNWLYILARMENQLPGKFNYATCLQKANNEREIGITNFFELIWMIKATRSMCLAQSTTNTKSMCVWCVKCHTRSLCLAIVFSNAR